MLIAIGYEAYIALSMKFEVRESFSPFRVIVQPKFDELLLDYKLLRDTQEVNALHAMWKKKDQKLISFTVLQLRASGEWLIYSDTHNYFLSVIDFEEPIEAIVFKSFRDQESRDGVYLRDPTLSDEGVSRPIALSFYFRQVGREFEIGLNVRDNWWEDVYTKNSTGSIAETEVHHNPIIGEAKLAIARIPNVAFALFHGQREPSSIERLWGAMDDQLASHGWKRKIQDPNAEVDDPWIRIEHKYFRVLYREI